VLLSKLFKPDFPFRPKSLPFHYGWVVAVAGATGIVASIPGQTIGVNVFNDELISALSISRSQVALAYFFGTATSGIMLFWAGKVCDRIGSRRLVVAANVALGLSMLYMSCVDWLPRFAAKVLGLDSPTSPMLVASLSVGFWMLRFSGQGFVTMAGRNMVAKWWRYHRGKHFSNRVVQDLIYILSLVHPGGIIMISEPHSNSTFSSSLMNNKPRLEQKIQVLKRVQNEIKIFLKWCVQHNKAKIVVEKNKSKKFLDNTKKII